MTVTSFPEQYKSKSTSESSQVHPSHPIIKMSAFTLSILLSLVCCCVAQEEDSPPTILHPLAINGETGSCPSAEVLDQAKNYAKQSITEILHNRTLGVNCPCGGPGEWRRIAQLDMNDPNQQCPNGLMLTADPVRGCGRPINFHGQTCISVMFSANNQPYSRVCGRVRAYLKGDAFGLWSNLVWHSRPALDGSYLDGVSLTHGAAGSRQHIWSFVASHHVTTEPSYNCPCTHSTVPWQYQIPAFIGENYFCETAYGPKDGNNYFLNDHLWDGEGCSFIGGCCQFNTPPWFCTTLPQSTTDDIELRDCSSVQTERGDVLLDIVDIYVM